MTEAYYHDLGFITGQILGVLFFFFLAGILLIVGIVKKNKILLICSVLLGIVAIGASVAVAPGLAEKITKIMNKQHGELVEVVASDKSSAVTVPGDWVHVDNLHPTATIAHGNALRSEYLLLLSEPKKDFAVGFDAYSKAIVDQMVKNIKDAQVGPLTDGTIDNLKTKQIRLEGQINNLKIVYLVTVLDGKDQFFQLISWTVPSKEQEAWPVFQKVAQSFRVVKTTN